MPYLFFCIHSINKRQSPNFIFYFIFFNGPSCSSILPPGIAFSYPIFFNFFAAFFGAPANKRLKGWKRFTFSQKKFTTLFLNPNYCRKKNLVKPLFFYYNGNAAAYGGLSAQDAERSKKCHIVAEEFRYRSWYWHFFYY